MVVDSIDGITTLNEFGAVVCSCNITPPLTTVYISNATVQNIPNQTNVLVDAENGNVWYIDNLVEDIKNSYYHSSDVGASFLDRLEGRLNVQQKYRIQSDKRIGLEFFVDKSYLSSLGIYVDLEKTNVDHLYFDENPHDGRRIKGLENTAFRIDEENCTDNKTHAEIYGVDEILV